MRRLRALIDGLPLDGALARSVQPDWWFWRAEHEMLAMLVEITHNMNIDPKKSKPLHIPRPYDKKPEPMTWAKLATQMGGAPDA